MGLLDGVELELVDSVAHAERFLRWLAERRPVLAIDVETGGLDPETDALRLVQFGDEHRGWAIPWDHWGGVALEAIAQYEGELVGHNVGFDARFLELHSGTRLPRERIHDTMTMAHLLDPTQRKGLKPLAARLVDSRGAYASRMLDEAMTKQRWTWATVPIDFEPYWAYGCLDTVLTAHLHRILRPQVERSYKHVYDLEQACSWVLRDMERRGVRVDIDYTHRKRMELDQFGQQVADWCVQAHGVRPGSNAAVSKRLLELGIPLTKRTKSGALALDEETILEVLGVSELDAVDPTTLDAGQQLAHQVLLRRKAEKIRSTYLDTFLERADAADVVHCRINQLGARTGRMSVDTPALQTLPRGSVVRDCFIPREGSVLLSADYDAIEMRLLAHFAQDEALLTAIADTAVDIHTAMARAMYDDQSLGKKDPRRQVMKNVNFAKLYGAGLEKIALTAGVPVPQAQEFLTMYDSAFPGVRRFQRQVGHTAEERQREEGVAYVKTPVGRFQPADDNRGYSLVNYLIQGTAADVLKETLVRLDEAGASDWMLLPVHDEIIFTVPEAETGDAMELISTVMPDDRWAVPLTVGIDGPLKRWGDKHR